MVVFAWVVVAVVLVGLGVYTVWDRKQVRVPGDADEAIAADQVRSVERQMSSEAAQLAAQNALRNMSVYGRR